VLALAAGEVVSTDRLIEAVWNGRPPATAQNTLQSHVSYLRGLLGDRETIVARPPGYLLDIGADGTRSPLRPSKRGGGRPSRRARWHCCVPA
jgi:DNA-binding SARP family transcriptional activator